MIIDECEPPLIAMTAGLCHLVYFLHEWQPVTARNLCRGTPGTTQRGLDSEEFGSHQSVEQQDLQILSSATVPGVVQHMFCRVILLK